MFVNWKPLTEIKCPGCGFSAKAPGVDTQSLMSTGLVDDSYKSCPVCFHNFLIRLDPFSNRILYLDIGELTY